MTMIQLNKQSKDIKERCSPEIVRFDPVIDRDPLDVMREEMASLKSKVIQSEKSIETKFTRIEETLDNIVQTLELYAANGSSSSYSS